MQRLYIGMFKKIIIGILFILTQGNMLAVAQNESAENDPYAVATAKAYRGEYDEALKLLQQILVNIPEHHDAKFLIGLVNAWDKQYTEARKIFTELIENNYHSTEVFQALARVEIWDKNPLQALKICKDGLDRFTDDITLQYLKAEALAALRNDEEAIDLLNDILEEEPEHEEAKKLLKELLARKNKNAVSVDYAYSWFSNTFEPWHRTTVEYRRNFKVGPVVGRVNHGYMYNRSTFQGEVDAYPFINQQTYSYLNMGVSDGKVFPEFRFGAELYRLFPANFEASLGIRGLYFKETDIYIYTLQLGNYLPGYWVSLRGFLTELEGKTHYTGLLVGRKYFGSKDHYFSVHANWGTAPLKVVSLTEIQRLDASMLAFDYQFPLPHQFFLRFYAEYQYEQYPEVRTTQRYTLSFRVEKRF